MQNRDSLAESFFQSRCENRRERDLRHEQERLLSAPHDFAHHFDVDLRFAAAGHSFENEWRERAEGALDRIDRIALFAGVTKFLRCDGIESCQKGVERVASRTAFDADDFLLRQRTENRCAHSRMFERCDGEFAAALCEEVDCGLLLRGEPLTRPSATLSPLRGARGNDETVIRLPAGWARSDDEIVILLPAGGEKVPRSGG